MNVIDVLGKDYTGKTHTHSIILYDTQITSLKGSPNIIKGSFNCSLNQLTSLKYGPTQTNDYDCCLNRLTNLKHAPKIINGNFYCRNNPFLPLIEIILFSLNAYIKYKIQSDYIFDFSTFKTLNHHDKIKYLLTEANYELK